MATIKDLTKECRVEFVPRFRNYCVFYKDVILWSTLYSDLDGVTITLDKAVEEYDDETYTSITILGKTPVINMPDSYDYSTYGDWESEEEAEKWLKNPKVLY